MVRVLLSICLIALLAQPLRAAPPEPQDLDELAQALDALAERIERVTTLAARDKRWQLIDAYKDKSDEDFRRRRDPKAEDIFDIIIDEEAPEDLRRAAQARLLDVRATTLDPDLQERKSRSRSRLAFATRTVVRHVSDKDLLTRELVHEMLFGLFPAAKREVDLRAYNPKSESRSDWISAERAWKAFLRK
jgi:hypothetical protein